LAIIRSTITPQLVRLDRSTSRGSDDQATATGEEREPSMHGLLVTTSVSGVSTFAGRAAVALVLAQPAVVLAAQEA
jgi:hypothetical protein